MGLMFYKSAVLFFPGIDLRWRGSLGHFWEEMEVENMGNFGAKYLRSREN
jgi:hypothetical protein